MGAGEGKEMRSRVAAFLKGKDSPGAQVIKYALCGGLSVAVDQLTFYLLAWLALPALRASDPAFRLLAAMGLTVQAAGEDELRRNFWIIKGVCFVLANSVVYLLNTRYVFHTGRHRKPVEILLFFGSSTFQFFFIWLGGILITVFRWEVTYSNIAMLTTSLFVNFVVRKKLVFKS
jgi:putative flippase GtrA